jgi:hypothetical protein
MNLEPHRLLVVTDGSQRDAAVLTAAVGLLRPTTAVTLLRVVTPPADGSRLDDLLPAVDRAERAAMSALRRQACGLAGPNTAAVVLVGDDADAEIAAWVEAHPVDAVLMPAPERRGLGLLWPGRRAPRLTRLGHTPVITVYPASPAGPTRRQTLPAA